MNYEFKVGAKLNYLGDNNERPGHGEIVEARNDGGIEQYLVELTDDRRIGCLRGEIKESSISSHYDTRFEVVAEPTMENQEWRKDQSYYGFDYQRLSERIKKKRSKFYVSVLRLHLASMA